MSAQSLPVVRYGRKLITYSIGLSDEPEDYDGPPRPMIYVHEVDGQTASQEMVDDLLRRPAFARGVWRQHKALLNDQPRTIKRLAKYYFHQLPN